MGDSILIANVICLFVCTTHMIHVIGDIAHVGRLPSALNVKALAKKIWIIKTFFFRFLNNKITSGIELYDVFIAIGSVAWDSIPACNCNLGIK